MSKYIIDLRPDCKVVQQICASNENVNVGARSIGLLDALTDDYIKENFKYLLDAEYQRGFEDGKAVNDKGCEGCIYAVMGSDTTICSQCCNAYPNQWTAKDDEIEVGDEVKSLNDSGVEIEGLLPWVVTTVDQGDYCQGIDSKGEVHATKKVRACKTGRHFDIQKILEDMKHD